MKYLSTLERSLEPMYTGTPEDIIESLPTLMNNVKMMYTIARYYSTPERMTILFKKMTNQMIQKCKEHITASGKLWDQDKPTLVANMQVTCLLSSPSAQNIKSQFFLSTGWEERGVRPLRIYPSEEYWD